LWLRYSALITTAGTVLVIGAIIYRRLGQGAVVRTWQASQYWISYSDGFVRRGLPGQIVASVAGGPPSSATVTTVAVLLTALAGGAFVALAVNVYNIAETRWAAVTGATVVAVSPFTFSLLVQDAGRYDAVIFAAAALISLAGIRLKSKPTVIIVVSAAVLFAAATEEICVIFLAPLAAACLWRARVRPTTIAFALVPALVVAAASLLIPPSQDGLVRALRHAHSARNDIPLDGQLTAIGALRQTPGSIMAQMTGASLVAPVLLTAVFVTFYLCITRLVWTCLDRPQARIFRYFVALYAMGAVGSSLIGIDYRRWWAMAFAVTIWTAVVLCEPMREVRKPFDQPRAFLVVAMLAVSVLLQASPVAGLL
jgi:hypothetical protein